jgi:hypothetical protein
MPERQDCGLSLAFQADAQGQVFSRRSMTYGYENIALSGFYHSIFFLPFVFSLPFLQSW